MIDWMAFFETSIDAIHHDLAYVLANASGCREGWLQGELLLAGREYSLWTNESVVGCPGKVDLVCGNPPQMVAEIKIVGAHYSPKMESAVEADVERLRRLEVPDRYMLLVIVPSDADTQLGAYLTACSFSERCIDRTWEDSGLRLRVWRIG